MWNKRTSPLAASETRACIERAKCHPPAFAVPILRGRLKHALWTRHDVQASHHPHGHLLYSRQIDVAPDARITDDVTAAKNFVAVPPEDPTGDTAMSVAR